MWAALDGPDAEGSGDGPETQARFPQKWLSRAGEDGEEKRGAEADARQIRSRLEPNRFVFRGDVKSFYANIDHDVLLSLVRDRVQYLRGTLTRTVSCGR